MARSEEIARQAIAGLGDAKLGEWRERGSRGVFHLRRRLSLEEAVPVGEPRDIRGTAEETHRLNALRLAIPDRLWRILQERAT